MRSKKRKARGYLASRSQRSRNSNPVYETVDESVGVELVFRVVLAVTRIVGSILVTVCSVFNLSGYVG